MFLVGFAKDMLLGGINRDNRGMEEPILEPLLRRFRLKRVLNHLSAEDRVLDVGCGWNALTVRALAPLVREAAGIDRKVEDGLWPDNVRILRRDFLEPWDFPEDSFTAVLMLAVLEHLHEHEAEKTLRAAHHVLRKGGRLLLTVPTPRAKPVLEFLSYKAGLINRNEIEDHKIYYDRALLLKRLESCGFAINSYRTFQAGMNSFCLARKIES